MSVRQNILERLTESRNVAVEHAVELALADASPAEQIQLAEVLLERNRRPGWIALIRAFDRLDESIREKIIARPRDLFGPLFECSQDPEGPARENVITIVRSCADGKLVHLLAETLMDARVEVRELAAKSLLEAIRRLRSEQHDDPVEETAILRQVGRAVEFSLHHYKTHRQPNALLAVLIQERQQESLTWTCFQDPHDELTRAATLMLRSPSEPAIAAATLLALGSPLRPAAMAGLASVVGPTGEAIAAESYRLLDPVLREPAQSVAHLKLLTAIRKDAPWNLSNWPQWLRLIESVGIGAAQRLALYTRMYESIPADAFVWKLELLRAVFETDQQDAGRLIATLAGDLDERVARCAGRYLLHKRHPEWRPMAAAVLAKSPHMSVRRMTAGVSAAPPSRPDPPFEKVWSDYPKLPPVVQHTATRTADDKDPNFPEQLRAKLGSNQPQDAAQGLKMLGSLADLTPYRGQIISLCGSADPRIASVAVRLVGRLADPRLKDLLEAAAHHKDPRVRANAIEAMESLHIADRSQQVLAMLDSRHNRERANAIKAFSQFDFATARECLIRMLTDPNPLHRISALWVVSQLQVLEIVRQVSATSRRDPNMRVRRRAADMIETLTGDPGTVITHEQGPT